MLLVTVLCRILCSDIYLLIVDFMPVSESPNVVVFIDHIYAYYNILNCVHTFCVNMNINRDRYRVLLVMASENIKYVKGCSSAMIKLGPRICKQVTHETEADRGTPNVVLKVVAPESVIFTYSLVYT